MDKIINFKAISKTLSEIQPKPYPAVKILPDWFRDAKPYIEGENKLTIRNRITNYSFKRCTPMLDSMSAGYIISLWADVLVSYEITTGEPNITWKTHRDVFNAHGSDTRNVVPPVGYHNQVFKYLNCWIPQTPKGYSVLIVPPLGHHDLPFRAIPAIIDSDSSNLEVLFPMWVKSNFEGVVEKGTPLVQIIPFKRDNWQATFNYYEDGEFEKHDDKNFRGTIVGHYIKNHWSKKNFK